VVNKPPPTFTLFIGVITSQSAGEGMWNTLTFGFHGYAVWDNTRSLTIDSGLQADNPPSQDVMLTAPAIGSPALMTLTPNPDGTQRAYFTPLVWGTPYSDCGP
jgi:hypothetical protein